MTSDSYRQQVNNIREIVRGGLWRYKESLEPYVLEDTLEEVLDYIEANSYPRDDDYDLEVARAERYAQERARGLR